MRFMLIRKSDKQTEAGVMPHTRAVRRDGELK